VLAIEPRLEQQPGVPLIGLNVNGLMYNGGYTRNNMFGLKCNYKIFVQQLVQKLLAETTAHILLVPHTFTATKDVNSDPDACREIFLSTPEYYKTRLHLVTREYNQHEIKGIIGLCDFFIGSRMHACIAALSQGIPTVGIAYSRKFRGIFQSVGAENMVIDARVDGKPPSKRYTGTFKIEKAKAALQGRVGETIKFRKYSVIIKNAARN
jgi:polysaccharide pyruvyl transferase WcaK-like protein